MVHLLRAAGTARAQPDNPCLTIWLTQRPSWRWHRPCVNTIRDGPVREWKDKPSHLDVQKLTRLNDLVEEPLVDKLPRRTRMYDQHGLDRPAPCH